VISHNLSGDAAQIWTDRQVGNIYKWNIRGVDGHWSGEAQKYRLEVAERDLRFRFVFGELEIWATGQFLSEVVADGAVHRDSMCRLEGSRIWMQQLSQSSESA
jgi:hypothetical protein